MEEINYICNNCGECFKSRKKDRKYCSRKCQYGQWRKEAESKRVRICQWCNKEFVMRGLSGKAKRGEVTEGLFCSRKCRWAIVKHNNDNGRRCNVHFEKCLICFKLFTTNNKLKNTCSDNCKHIFINKKCAAYQRGRYKPKDRIDLICQQCDSVFSGHKGDSYCSDICRQKIKQSRKAKRRANKRGVYYEPVDPLKVFERDGWKCQLCGKKLKKKHRGSYRDDAPELDHIISWSNGGEHSYRNTQCACRKCNSEKRDKSMGQLKLFGQ